MSRSPSSFSSYPATAQPLAGDCVIGPGLGATLLYPYFEADLTSFSGPTTLISINNGLFGEALVRVTFWTDWGNPTLAFDMYLASFSVNTINLRDTFNGGIPSTGEGVDLSGFPFCDSLPPFHSNPALSANEVAQLQADHTGQIGPLAGDCGGSMTSDQIARGYITVDVVDECSGVEGFAPTFTPANQSYPYFADGDEAGIGININRLWGDIFYLSNDDASAHGSPAVPLWADATLFGGSRVYTFYGRLSGWDGRDNRVPLPRRWDQRFINGGPFAGGASMIVYHDPGVPPDFALCGTQPAAFPLDGGMDALRDSGEDLLDLNSEFADIAGLATQRGLVGDLAIPYSFGWIQLDTDAGDAEAQMWVQPTLSASGIYSASPRRNARRRSYATRRRRSSCWPLATDDELMTSERAGSHLSDAAKLKLALVEEGAGQNDVP